MQGDSSTCTPPSQPPAAFTQVLYCLPRALGLQISTRKQSCRFKIRSSNHQAFPFLLRTGPETRHLFASVHTNSTNSEQSPYNLRILLAVTRVMLQSLTWDWSKSTPLDEGWRLRRLAKKDPYAPPMSMYRSNRFQS